MRDKRPPTDFPLIIDAHTHMGFFRNFHIPDNGAAGMVRVMDALGVDACCVASHAAISADYRMGNDLVAAAMRDFPGRFVGYAVVNPNYPDDVEAELERCVDGMGMRGIKVHPELHGDYPLDGEGYAPMWAFAQRRGLPLLSHTYFGGDRLEVFEALAKRYPGVTILLGHCGYDLGIDRVLGLVRRTENLVLDLTGQPLRATGLLERLVRAVGAERIVYGSDMPFIDAPAQLGTVVFAQIPRPDKEKILGLNAKRILRLDAADLRS